MNDMEIIFASFKSTPKALKYLHTYGWFKINETIIRELRKKFGVKLINKYLDPDERDLRFDKGSEEYNNVMKLIELMKR